jgi:hypothetical protein
MTQAIATEVKDATKRPITQADLRLLRLRMTVALLRRAWQACWWALKWADEGMTDLVRSAFEDAIASVVA